MNTREILQTYGPIYSYMNDRELFNKLSDIAYRQIGHGVSHDYWKKAYGSRGYITPVNIRKHIEDAVAEQGAYSDVAMAVGLARYRRRKQEEAAARI